MSEAANAFEWTSAQQEVIDAPIESKLLVTADAGTGKTEVLIHRLTELVDRETLAAGSEMLTVSFTRSAVGEIRERLAGRESAARYATTITFDSFATRLLRRHFTGDDWQAGSYDDRIRSATSLLEESESARKEIGALKHFAVDEIQDLVGVRLEFMKVLIDLLRCGFTLLGDPAQAIYGWQLKSGASEVTLFEWARKTQDRLLEIRLSGNFRAETAVTKSVLAIGAALNSGEPDYGAICDQLLDHADELPRFKSIDQLSVTLKRVDESIAILCRTNGQALEVSGSLWQNGVEHQLRRGSSDPSIAPWIGRVMSAVGTPLLSRRSFTSKVDSAGIGGEVDDLWADLKRVERRRGDSIEVEALRRNIALQYVPDDICSQKTQLVVVSTIHRAKGLEFGSVVLIRPDDEMIESNLPEETRTLYVAMTRPRRYIMLMPDRVARGIRLDKRTGRWIRTGPKRWQTFGFEVRGNDMRRLAPVSGRHPDRTASDLQDYLWSQVSPGDEVYLELQGVNDEGIMQYGLVHDDVTIGLSADGFAEQLSARISPHSEPKRWPKQIEGLRVEAIDTVAGTAASSEQAGLGTSGLWIRPRVVGLGRLVW